MNGHEFIIVDRDTDGISKKLGKLEESGALTVLSKCEFSSIGMFLKTDKDISNVFPQAKKGTFEEFSKLVKNMVNK